MLAHTCTVRSQQVYCHSCHATSHPVLMLAMQGPAHAGRAFSGWEHLVCAEAEQHVHHHTRMVCPACCSGSQVQGCPSVSQGVNHIPPYKQAPDSPGSCQYHKFIDWYVCTARLVEYQWLAHVLKSSVYCYTSSVGLTACL